MYFKQAGRKTQVLAYRGYNREKKRADVRMIGSIDGYTFRPTVRYEDSITEVEYEEINTYIESVRQADIDTVKKISLNTLVHNLKSANAALETLDITEDQAKKIWEEVETLGKRLRKQGFPQRKLLRG